jgi:hypothetical protein
MTQKEAAKLTLKDMKSLILFLAIAVPLFLFSCYLTILAVNMPDDMPSTPKPSIYITRTDHLRTLDGGELWVLEYTVNGELQAPAFSSQKAMTEYRAYLDTIGTVYRKEEE